MKYTEVKVLSNVQFYRLTGVKKETFGIMLAILKTEEKERKQRGGSKRNIIKLPDVLLMTLEYLRDYLPILKETKVLTDTGYLGILNWHSKTELPIKATIKNPFTSEDKKYNRALSKERIVVENVIACVKKFRLLSETYRNRRKRFSLRFNLIAGIYNYELL